MVQEVDLKAFEWMSENIKQDMIVLNNANVGNRKSVVFASDGGAWIPVFTNLQIAMPFTEFSSQNTHDNYEMYLKIIGGYYSCEDLDYLLNKDIKYYFQGSKGVFGGQINPENNNENFELVFTSGTARVFRLIPCGN